MILDNSRITIREVADDVDITFGSCHAIFTDILDTYQPSQATNESAQSLNNDSRYRIQTSKEALSKGTQPQLIKGWAVTEEVLDSLQLLLIATYPAIIRLGSRFP